MQEPRVIEQPQAQQHGLEIEPVVIPGEDNAALQEQDTEGGEKPEPSRAEDQERQAEFDEKHAAGGKSEEIRRQ